MERKNIHFTIRHRDEELAVEVWQGSYRNLMALINEMIYVEDFGECRGIGRCGTCLVYVSGPDDLPEMDRNEKETLMKAMVQGKEFRLSCQLMIDHNLDGQIITIAEDRIDVR